ncbi:MAG: hypothetical protein CSA70_01910 [Rhodobacterales bacterium]|nr:MAG: hypothetical protein CSA70_01910 [Rhodobacterales bacterium]
MRGMSTFLIISIAIPVIAGLVFATLELMGAGLFRQRCPIKPERRKETKRQRLANPFRKPMLFGDRG